MVKRIVKITRKLEHLSCEERLGEQIFLAWKKMTEMGSYQCIKLS